MMAISSFLLVCLSVLVIIANGDQFPLLRESSEDDRVPRVAIVGAGAGGASTAYHLARLAGNSGNKVDITIYERNNYVGGRSTTVNVFDDIRYPIELGASIFVPANTILVEAAKELGLEVEGKMFVYDEDDDDSIGIWDGTQFVFSQKRHANYYWSIVKLIARYGFAPLRARNLGRAAINKFFNMYKEPDFPFTNLTNTSLALGLTEMTSIPSKDYFKKQGIGELFTNDFIQALTRVNYAQNLDQIQALEALVCVYASNNQGLSVIGGNWRIFNEMIIASGAKLHLETSVNGIEKIEYHGKTKWRVYSNDNEDESELFDGVVLASPYHMSNISMNPLPAAIQKVTYMTLHVTLVATKAPVRPGFFNLDHLVPAAILTTLPTNISDAPFFNSLSRVGLLHSGESVWKIFSPKRVTEETLKELFGDNAKLDWIHRKVWKAYPLLDPVEEFAPIELYPRDSSAGVWYTSGIESFISTMETSALSGRNIAHLIARRLWDTKEIV